MWVLKSSFSCYHMPALKPLLPGLYTRLLALKVSRFLYYTFLMSIFAKGNNSKNRKGNNRKNNRKKSSLGYLLIILYHLFRFVQTPCCKGI